MMRSMRTAFLSTLCFALLVVCGLRQASGTIIYDTLGDTTYETVYDGGGAGESLAGLVQNYLDPATGEPSPILAADGRPLVVGAEALGEDPASSDQTQVQRFLVADNEEEVRVRYLGLGAAGFRSVFGAYYYPVGSGLEEAIYEPLFIQNVTAVGTESLFTVPVDHHFGFYLDANGHASSAGLWHTENAYNSDNPPDAETDHFLMFNTNRGVMLAIEDLPQAGNGRLGDQDYEDLLVGFITKGNGEPIPMPPSRVAPEPSGAVFALSALVAVATGRCQRGISQRGIR